MTQNTLALFQQACGMDGPLTLRLGRNGSPQQARRKLERPFLIAGRSPHADWTLDDPAVSMRHVYLQMVGGQVFCHDLASRTGIQLAGQSVDSGWLTQETPLNIGPFTLQHGEVNSPSNNALVSHPDPLKKTVAHDPLPGVILEITSADSSIITSWQMQRTLVMVGSSSRCKLRLSKSKASKFVCSLVRTSLGLWVVDLLAEKGPLVNGKRHPWSRLEEGDDLRIGEYTLRVRYALHPLSSPHPSAEASPLQVERVAPEERTSKEPAAQQASAASLIPCSPVTELPSQGRARKTTLSRTADSLLSTVDLPDDQSVSTQLFLALSNQFSLMQHQMFDQMTQAMMTMGQMFGQLQGQQMQFIREELDRLHKVTLDLHELQAELLKTRAEAPATDGPPQRVETPKAPPRELPPSTGSNSVSPPAASANPPPHASPAKATPKPVAPSTPQGNSAQQPGNPGDIHDLICQRIEALQQERQSRWQSILQFVMGKKQS